MSTEHLPKPSNEDATSEIPADLAEVIQELPIEKKNVIIKAFIQRHHSGPLPDGESIRIYNEIIPQGGDRIMKTIEKQLEHRISAEKEGIKRSFNQSATGQWMAFALALGFGLAAWDLAKNGHEVTAAILGTVDLVALVTVFITGKSSKK